MSKHKKNRKKIKLTGKKHMTCIAMRSKMD